MKSEDVNKIFFRIYKDLIHQAYVWIRDNSGPGGSKCVPPAVVSEVEREEGIVIRDW